MKDTQKKGAGRPHASIPMNAVFQLRLTESEHRQLKELGGAKWVRRKLVEEIHGIFN